MAIAFRKILGATSLIGMAISLAACEPDGPSNAADEKSFSLFDAAGPLDWPMDQAQWGPEGKNQAYGSDWAPLAATAPMVSDADRSYGYAQAWDYPESYRYDDAQYDDAQYDNYDEAYADYDPGYYEDSPGGNTYALLALAAVLGNVIGNAPPDYSFDYDGVKPWVWVTDDRYARYAEPLRNGYRYYYYAPGAARPFLVRDPYYSYGYRGDRLVAIYDTYGRVLNNQRALPLRRAAASYYDRGLVLQRYAGNHPRRGVSAPIWQQRRNLIVTDQNRWERARGRSEAWQSWDRRYEEAGSKRWRGERIARRYSAERFATWQKADYRGPAPRVKRELRNRPQLRTAALGRAVAEVRRDERPAMLRRTGNDARRIAAGRPIEHGGLTRATLASERSAPALRGGGHIVKTFTPAASRPKATFRQVADRSDRRQGLTVRQNAAAQPHDRAAGLRAAPRKQPEKLRRVAAPQQQRASSLANAGAATTRQGLQRQQPQRSVRKPEATRQQAAQRQPGQQRNGLQQRQSKQQQQAISRASQAKAQQAQQQKRQAQVQSRTQQVRPDRRQAAQPKQAGLTQRSSASARPAQAQRQAARPSPERRPAMTGGGNHGQNGGGPQAKGHGLRVR